MTGMPIATLISAVIAPALFWSGYLYYKDRFQPEPLLKFGTAYLAGIGAAFLCLAAFRLLTLAGIPFDPSALMETGGVPFLIYSLAATGLVEESFKLLPFVLFVVRFRSFNEKTDGIIYASAVALGFASVENIRVLANFEGWELFGRAIASPLTHTMFASVWGYAIGCARIRRKPILWPAIMGLGIGATAHGLFNFFSVSPKLRLGAALLILVIWIWQIRILEKAVPRLGRKKA